MTVGERLAAVRHRLELADELGPRARAWLHGEVLAIEAALTRRSHMDPQEHIDRALALIEKLEERLTTTDDDLDAGEVEVARLHLEAATAIAAVAAQRTSFGNLLGLAMSPRPSVGALLDEHHAGAHMESEPGCPLCGVAATEEGGPG